MSATVHTAFGADLPKGISRIRPLPDPALGTLWDSIFIDEGLKRQLLSQAMLNFSMRGKVPRTVIPLHGVILLTGEPGTGKTSLARGLAHRTATSFSGARFNLLEVEPHSLTSSAMGKTQRAVSDLFSQSIAEAASSGPTIVLLDEVETLAADRSKMSLEANPIDIHRATDAVLVQLDALAEQFPQLLFVATSNFPDAVDSAFTSRCDLVLRVRREHLVLEADRMITIDEAFRKFKSRLELNDKEQQNASDRQNEVRDYLVKKFAIDRSFLTGSYKRHTKTKPLKDIDIFFVLNDSEKSKYRDNAPSVVIGDFYDALVEKYGSSAVRKQGRSVNVDFGVVVDSDDNTNYRVLSVDVVPAFASASDYEIPDTDKGEWIKTNPETHAAKATTAHQAYSNEWKGLVRMVKYWNNQPRHGAKPVKPSFLIEVMALECLYGGWQGNFAYEFQSLFATLADRIFDTWQDPAGLGPPVSDGMDNARKERARTLLMAASREASLAINLARQGKNGEALKAWRALFGPKFPLS